MSFAEVKKPQRRYNIPVLSGSAYVGQLFDGTKDQLLLDQFFWKPYTMRIKVANITNVQFETTIGSENRQDEKMDQFEMDDSTKISFMGGLIKVKRCQVLSFRYRGIPTSCKNFVFLAIHNSHNSKFLPKMNPVIKNSSMTRDCKPI